MIYALLGDVALEVPQWPTALDRRQSHNWAEHQPVNRPPLLQSTGRNLVEFTLEARLHRQFGTAPQAALATLRQAVADGNALSLVFGTGEYPGKFVIVDMGERTESAGPNGDVDSATVSLSLKEYFENDRLASPIRKQFDLAQGLRRQLANGLKKIFQ